MDIMTGFFIALCFFGLIGVILALIDILLNAWIALQVKLDSWKKDSRY